MTRRPTKVWSPIFRESGGLGTMIRTGRRELGLTQEQFATLLGTTANTVARWERGEVTPSPAWRRRLEVMTRSRGRWVPGDDPLATWRSLWGVSQRFLGAAMRGRENPDRPVDPAPAIPRLLAAARAANIPLVVMGGLAVIAWGVERLTKDLDAVGVPEARLDDFLEAASAEGFVVPANLTIDSPGGPFRKFTIYWKLNAEAVLPSVESRTVAIQSGAMPVDVMLMDDEFTENAVLRARIIETQYGNMPIVSLEDLMVFKLVAYREKDHLDALSLMRLHADDLDRKYLRRWTKRLGALQHWLDLIEEHRSGATGW